MGNTENELTKQLLSQSEETKKLFSQLGNIDNCDAECEKKKGKLDKEIKFLALSEQKNNIEEEYNLAEKNYIISDKGETYYNDYIQDNLKKKERDRLENIENIFNDQMKVYENVKTVVNNQKSFQDNFGAMKEIYVEATRRNEDIEEMKKNTKINDRYSFYETNDMGGLEKNQFILRVIYWILFSVIIIMIFLKGQYRNLKVYGMVLFLIFVPMLIPTISTGINDALMRVNMSGLVSVMVVFATILVFTLKHLYKIPFVNKKVIVDDAFKKKYIDVGDKNNK